jgi:exodeoxyribonuclease V alpha subunit
MIHLSARLAWHDNGWDGCICREPHLNSSCVVLENIREKRVKVEDKARAEAGVRLSELSGWLPPCCRDTAAYADKGFRFEHSDPLERDFLSPIYEDIPAYTCLPAPYRWLREENFQDICEAEGLSIRGPENREKRFGWVYEPDRQRELLGRFWGKAKEGEGKALVFYYVKQGNPVDENAARLIVGVGRLAKVGPALYFEGTDQEGERYPIWTRSTTQDYPGQGFRLPYQEYIREGLEAREIACYVPRSALIPFSFVGEHVTDDMAVGLLERLIQCVETIQRDAKVLGPWRRHLVWLNDRLAEVWQDRGPFPGIGSVLDYLDFPSGTAFHRMHLADFVRKNENPWAYVSAILEGSAEPPDDYATGLLRARKRWASLGTKKTRLELLDTLVRFELTTQQVRRICNPDEREAAGIEADEKSLVENPYVICEQDLGTEKSDRVDLEAIDRGMLPEGDAALFIPPESVVAQDDTRRIRAICMGVLQEAAELGDTVLTLSELLSRVRERFPDRRACHPDRDIFRAEAAFHGELLWLALDDEPSLVAIQHSHDLEQEIARIVRGRVKRHNPAAEPPIDWHAALHKRFGEPATDRERAALAEKAVALDRLYNQRISVLTGSAGTGKTSALQVFLDKLDEAEGKKAVYLLAPTGKARVRLSTTTERNAFTIHQFLLKHGWLRPEIYQLRREGGNRASAPTVIIDECSMVPTDLLGTLFRAISLDHVQRLILVGDPNQLPPIGPGRPFVDIVAWLTDHSADCVAHLRTTMRTAQGSDLSGEASVALAFADGYRSDSVNPGDDEILSRIARGESWGDLETHFWKDHDELKQLLKQNMRELLELGAEGDYATFNESLGIGERPWEQGDWRSAEAWQILSPLRIHPFGTDELNRTIQLEYRGGLIQSSTARWSKRPRPFGEQDIVYTDKVIQIANRRRQAWPRDRHALDYIANGEVGIVIRTSRGSTGDYLDVGFSTQQGVTYRHYRSQVEEELELAYAITVHKAQGSDFDVVFLIIPKEAQTLSRELMYTGLTRFRKRLVLLIEGDTEALQRLRLPVHSDTHLRSTNMFTLSMCSDEPGVPYPEALIHRTRSGVLVRSKSELCVAHVLDALDISWKYEEPLRSPDDERDFRLPDFTIGYEGDIYYWEHLGMLSLPTYREDWERKRDWYKTALGIPVVGPGAREGALPEPGVSPVVITSRDREDGGIDEQEIERLAGRYILLE